MILVDVILARNFSGPAFPSALAALSILSSTSGGGSE